MKQNKLAVLFDMDGTILDNMEVHHKAWQNELQKNGIHLTFEEVKEQIHGKNEEILKKIYGNHLTENQIQKLAFEKEKAYRELYAKDLKFRPGFALLVENLKQKNISIGMGTAAPIENVDFVLNGLRVREWFDTIVYAEMVKEGKPHPEVFLLGAEKLNVTPNNCLVFEDSPTGAKAAENAGMKICIVGRDYPQEQFKNIKNIVAFVDDFVGITPQVIEHWLN